jgi:hypothetical protein
MDLTPSDLDIWEYGFTLNEDGDAWVSLIKDRFDLGTLSDATDFTAAHGGNRA